jgi:UDP-3-O-[3-hydroxymyristoyl] glucosamine N-acyltransferase
MTIDTLLKEINHPYSGEIFEINSFNTLEKADKSQIAFIENELLLEELKITKAGAVILKEELVQFLPNSSKAIVSKNPHLDMAKLSKFFVKKPFVNTGKNTLSTLADIDKSAIVGDDSSVEEGVHIMAGVVIGAHVKIGKNSKIYPNVVIYDDTIIGENCFVYPGACIGNDGYGYAHTSEGKHIKIYHTGNVVLEDDVEIGANSTIDRAVFGSTRIGAGTKIDNLVQIGHNCELGESCIIVSQSGIAGSAKLGRNVVLGGQSAVIGHLSIGDFAQIAGRGAVTKSIEGGKVYGGFPLMLQKEWLKTQARMIKYFSHKSK